MIATLSLLTLSLSAAAEPATGVDKLVIFADRAYTAPGEVISELFRHFLCQAWNAAVRIHARCSVQLETCDSHNSFKGSLPGVHMLNSVKGDR